MADFIAPIVDWMLAALQNGLPDVLGKAELERFRDYRKSWTYSWPNWPPIAVMPRTTGFDREGTARRGTNALTIKFGVSGQDPDRVTTAAMAYMKAIDQVVSGADWPEQVSQVFIADHDYGPLWEKNGFFYFPEMHVEVEVYEL